MFWVKGINFPCLVTETKSGLTAHGKMSKEEHHADSSRMGARNLIWRLINKTVKVRRIINVRQKSKGQGKAKAVQLFW